MTDHTPEPKTCADCGLPAGESHRCGMAILLDAIGIVPDARERHSLRWVAQFNQETVDAIAALFRRVRALGSTKEAQAVEDFVADKLGIE